MLPALRLTAPDDRCDTRFEAAAGWLDPALIKSNQVLSFSISHRMSRRCTPDEQSRGCAMDEEALAFLERWIEVHAVSEGASSRSELAEKLAGQCYRDAEEAGFDSDAIDEAASEATDGEDLIAYI